MHEAKCDKTKTRSQTYNEEEEDGEFVCVENAHRITSHNLLPFLIR